MSKESLEQQVEKAIQAIRRYIRRKKLAPRSVVLVMALPLYRVDENGRLVWMHTAALVDYSDGSAEDLGPFIWQNGRVKRGCNDQDCECCEQNTDALKEYIDKEYIDMKAGPLH